MHPQTLVHVRHRRRHPSASQCELLGPLPYTSGVVEEIYSSSFPTLDVVENRVPGISGRSPARPVMTQNRHRVLIAYAVACTAVIAAAAVRMTINPLLIQSLPLITFYPAVMISGWFGGLGPGLLAMALSTAIAAFLSGDASHPFLNWFGLTLFAIVGVSISALNESLRRATALEHSSREDAERALAAETIAKQEAQRATHVKDTVLAMVSHEIRAPLNAILGWTDMLRKGVLADDQQRHALDAIHKNALHQNRLIDDLLDLTRIMAGKLRLDLVPVELSATIRAALDAIQPDAAAKHLHIALDFKPEAAVVRADPTRLQQIVWNLLTNAVKFTAPSGHIWIAVRHGPATLEIVVSDSGVGISPELLPFVFEPFRQADGALPHQSVGLGLGLAVVKQLAEAHGGTVSVSSDGANRGATFTVRLPAAVEADHDGSDRHVLGLARGFTHVQGVRVADAAAPTIGQSEATEWD